MPLCDDWVYLTIMGREGEVVVVIIRLFYVPVPLGRQKEPESPDIIRLHSRHYNIKCLLITITIDRVGSDWSKGNLK